MSTESAAEEPLADWAVDVCTDDVLRKHLTNDDFKRFVAARSSRVGLDLALANSVGHGLLRWALSRGATHYVHWFQPLSGVSAEKHDAFLELLPAEGPFKKLLELDGKQLIKGETDGSSFPSGGLRSTFEARGYTVWDTSSPAFVKQHGNGRSLFIPTALVSWNGASLDTKTALLRSEEAVSRAAVRVLRALGDRQVQRVFSNLGPEQEFFCVDRKHLLSRPDLRMCGRTLVGGAGPLGQLRGDHYFGRQPERVTAMLREVESIMWKLGVPLKTRHNEVSPGQFEIAPIYQSSPLACDQNMLTMDVLTAVAERHGLAVLLNEKPFVGVNGSGKHNNISYCTDTGRNLFAPGDHPEHNHPFLMFLAAIIAAVHKHGAVLRAAVAVPGNDYRLGGHEAPPAIMSIYVGDELDRLCQRLMGESAAAASSSSSARPSTPVVQPADSAPTLALYQRDTTDRNRTSPFAFTHNKYEFRAVGSSQSCASTVAVINTVMAKELTELAEKMEAEASKAQGTFDAIAYARTLVSETIKQHYAAVFNGNGYSDEWVKEAARRGLPNLATGPDALAVYDLPTTVDLFTSTNVLTAEELRARTEVLHSSFLTTVEIESDVLANLVTTSILPACLKYQQRLASTVLDTHSAIERFEGSASALLAGAPVHQLLKRLMEAIARLSERNAQMVQTLHELKADRGSSEDPRALLRLYHPQLRKHQAEVRESAEVLEGMVDAELWPLPKQQDILSL